MSKIGLAEVKQALRDSRFRDSLPPDLASSEEMEKFLHRPGCPSCSISLCRKIIKECKKELREYFPGKAVIDEAKEVEKLALNHWSIINCHVDELEKKLKLLHPGRKQIAISRYEDQVTVVVNELDVIF